MGWGLCSCLWVNCCESISGEKPFDRWQLGFMGKQERGRDCLPQNLARYLLSKYSYLSCCLWRTLVSVFNSSTNLDVHQSLESRWCVQGSPPPSVLCLALFLGTNSLIPLTLGCLNRSNAWSWVWLQLCFNLMGSHLFHCCLYCRDTFCSSDGWTWRPSVMVFTLAFRPGICSTDWWPYSWRFWLDNLGHSLSNFPICNTSQCCCLQMGTSLEITVDYPSFWSSLSNPSPIDQNPGNV